MLFPIDRELGRISRIERQVMNITIFEIWRERTVTELIIGEGDADHLIRLVRFDGSLWLSRRERQFENKKVRGGDVRGLNRSWYLRPAIPTDEECASQIPPISP